MGVEYKLTCRDFAPEFYERLIEKTLSVIDPDRITQNNGDIEIRFDGETDGMPDIAIQRTSELNEFIFLYNGGTMSSWSIFGLLISYLSQHAKAVIVTEL
jgi:hypothetical protein